MQQQQSGGMMSGLLGTVAQGFAFGTGSAVAHRAVGAVAEGISGSGEKHAPQEHQMQAQPAQGNQMCTVDQQNLINCLQQNNGDAQSCQFFFDSLQNCQQNQQFA
eukprot:scaffold83_cov246-Pinguiococcus_pyrenoidosus.AAC.24